MHKNGTTAIDRKMFQSEVFDVELGTVTESTDPVTENDIVRRDGACCADLVDGFCSRTFFTFQMMSYVFDVYYRKCEAQKSYWKTVLSVSLFVFVYWHFLRLRS